MTRAALPQNYVLGAGTLLEGFETLADWTKTGGANGTIDADSVNVKSGTNSLRLNIAVAAQYIYATKTIDYTNTGDSLFRLWVYCTASHANSETRIRFSSTTDFSKYFQYTWYGLPVGWNLLTAHRDDFTNTGAESWNNTMIRMQVWHWAGAGTTPSASFDKLQAGEDVSPRCLITFDDGFGSVYSEAYAYMAAKGIRGTAYVCSGTIGDAGCLTLANLTTMAAAGWTIANHTAEHTTLSGLSAAALAAAVTPCTEYLLANGFTNGAYHISYPGGEYDAATLTNCAALGMKTGRILVDSRVPQTVENNMLVHSRAVGNTKSLATAKGYIDTAIRNSDTVCLLFHDLVETADSANEWGISDFQALIDYIVSKRIECVTIDEWYEGLTNYRYRSLPLSRATA